MSIGLSHRGPASAWLRALGPMLAWLFLCFATPPSFAQPMPAAVPRRPVRSIVVGLAPDSAEGALRAPGTLSALAERTGALAIERPFEGLSPQSESDRALARMLRVVYPEGSDPAALAVRWRAVPGVAWARPEGLFRITAGVAPAATNLPFDPDDPLFVDGSQWGLLNTGAGVFGGVAGEDIRARAGWAVTTGSTAVTIGIVDTGTDLSQPELAGLLADGSPRIVAAYNSSDEGALASPWDSVGHGTMVTGVAAARTNNGPLLDGRGVAGVCGGAGGDSAGCRLVLVKTTPTRLIDALSSEIVRGIVYAVDHGARAINLSFASDDDDPLMRLAISYAARRGAVLVCAAGNGQDARPQFPGYYARYGAGVSVAALRPNGTLARFSTRGPQIDVAAPGEDIYSTYLTYANAYGAPARNYQYTSGTSLSAPFVTGLAGLAAALQPSLTDNEFQEVLRRTARDAGAPGRDDTYGWGVPDAGALLTALEPPAGFERGIASAGSWAFVNLDSITLSNTPVRFDGCATNGRYLAERWEVRAAVTSPVGRFLEPPRVIVRAHDTRAWGLGPLFEYDLGWGEAVPGSVSATGFELRGYVYKIDATPASCPSLVPTGFLPTSPQAVAFAWSALGKLDQPPVVRFLEPQFEGAAWPVDRADTLRWEASDTDTITRIEIAWSSDGGASWRTVATLPGEARSCALAAPCERGKGAIVRLRAMDAHQWSDETSITRGVMPDRACLPGEDPNDERSLALLPIAPQPAIGGVTLRYRVPNGGVVPGQAAAVLTVHDARGRALRRWALDAPGAGPQAIVWDGRDAAGRAVSPGLYFARLAGSGRADSRRFVFLGAGTTQ